MEGLLRAYFSVVYTMWSLVMASRQRRAHRWSVMLGAAAVALPLRSSHGRPLSLSMRFVERYRGLRQ